MLPEDRPSWVTLSSPGLDRPLVPAVERVARHLRAAAQELSLHVELPFQRLYAPRRSGLGFTLTPEQIALRSAWCLIGEWLVARAVGAHDGSATIDEAHAWFWAGDPEADVARAGTFGAFDMPIASASEVHALLPYLLDPASVSTRREMLRSEVSKEERTARKESGAYYTPGDVAFHMVGQLRGTKDTIPATWLDPANGSGVFLRAVLSMFSESAQVRDGLYGVDIDPFAAEATSFVLAAEDILRHQAPSAPWERWHHFRRNLATGNSLFIDAYGAVASKDDPSAEGEPLGTEKAWFLASAFPEIAAAGFSRVVANPPYAKLAQHPANVDLFMLHPVTGIAARADISPMFVELCLSLASSDGAISVVTPLSTITSTRAPFPQLRSLLASQQGSIAFSAFDRVPDALFGDDIKTRNALVLVDRSGPEGLTSTPLHRWTSRKRSHAFEGAQRASITNLPGVPLLIPKIGTEWERSLYTLTARAPLTVNHLILSRRSSALSQAEFVDNPRWSSTLALAPTAYNYLGLTRDPSDAVRCGHDSQNAVALLEFQTPRHASAAYALLTSRLSFWLWHVTGDGFHVSANLPRLIPVPSSSTVVDELATLGDTLWEETRAQPNTSKNRGKVTVSYPVSMSSSTLADIDICVDAALGVKAAKRLAEWHERLVLADDSSDRAERMKRNVK